MANILFLYENMIPSVEMSISFFEKLEENYECHVKCFPIKEIKKSLFNEADIIVGTRLEDPLSFSLLRQAKANNKLVIYNLDDDLKDLDYKSVIRFKERRKWLLKCLKEVDVLMTCNKLIAEEYIDLIYGKRTTVVNTIVSSEEINKKNENLSTKVKIVYAASTSHTVFFDTLIKERVLDVIYKYRNKVELFFVGVHPEFESGELSNHIHYAPYMNMQQYDEYMKNNEFDIGLAPLVTDHFTERKYFNKFIEYTKYSICGIYSNCMPFNLVVKNKENGIIANNNSDDWYEKICLAVEDSELRKKCVNNAQKYLLNCHSKNIILQNFVDDIPELICDYGNKSSNCNFFVVLPKIKYLFFRLRELMYKTYANYKKNGAAKTFEKMKRKFHGNI